MPIARLSIRPTPGNRRHNLWLNNGTYWAHYTLNWDGRTRRIRRSLRTQDVDEAIARRDALFARIAAEGEEIPERAPRRRRAADATWEIEETGSGPRRPSRSGAPAAHGESSPRATPEVPAGPPWPTAGRTGHR